MLNFFAIYNYNFSMNKKIKFTLFLLLLSTNLLIAQNNTADSKLNVSINNFNDKIFTSLCDTDQNVSFSSISIYNQLYYLLNASDETTQKQISNFLELNTNADFNDLEKIFSSVENMNNSIWYANQLTLNKDIFSSNKNAIEFKKVDFYNPKTKNKINDYISKKTNHQINDFLKDLDSNNKAIFINTLYFEQKWETPFKSKSTESQEFFISKDNSKTKLFMQNETVVKYYERQNLKIVELPYKNERYSMLIFLPSQIDFDFSKINLSELTKTFFTSEDVQNKFCLIKLPKFTSDYKTDIFPLLLENGIEKISMPKLFKNNQGILIDEILHEAKVSIDEEKTKAAAVTLSMVKSAHLPPDTSFIADHPFCYTIYDKELGINLFTGIIRDPQQ